MRLYHALLHLYPASFRAEYREELCDAFAERARELSGLLAPVWIVLAALADVIPNAVAAHWDVLRQDARYAARSLRRTPGFALTAVLVAALGVGANTAVFSLADLVFVRPLPYADAGRLVKLWQREAGGGTNEVSPANYRDWKAMTSAFSGVGAYWRRAANLVGAAEPRRLETVRATPELLPLLGVAPLIGRVFTAEDVRTGQFVLLSHALWKSHFSGDPNVIGTSVRLDGTPHTVIGVMPASFQFPDRSVEAWTPLVLHEDDYVDRSDTYLEVVGRLRPGVSAGQARRQLAVVSARLARQYPKENKDTGVAVLGLRDELSERARLLVLALCGATLCILLLACANLASLFLARGAHRARELAVRAALGAGRERLVRQLVTESVGIAFAGGIVGVAAAAAGEPLLARLVPSTLPVTDHASLDLRVLGLAAAFVLLTGLVFGLAPAVRAGRSSALDALRGGTRTAGGRTQRLRAALVIVEVAASVVLLVTSGLLIRAVWRIQTTDPGFVADNVLTLQTALPLPKYDSTLRRAQYYDHVLQEVRALPGVRDAAYATGLPMSMRGGIWPVSFKGQEVIRSGANNVSLRYVTPRFFATLGIPLRLGRDVAATDTREQPSVAVVSESFVKRHWPNESPLGKRFNVALDERTVVGVVGDVRVRGLERPSEPQGTLTIASNDPDTPVVNRTLTARTPPFLSLHAGLAEPHGVLKSSVRQGSAFHLDFVYPWKPRWAWDVRLGSNRFDGRPCCVDVSVATLSSNAKYTFNPASSVHVFVNGGLGLYHFNPGRFEGGGDLGLGLNVPVGHRFALELTYNYDWAFTASPDLKFSQVQLGLLVSF